MNPITKEEAKQIFWTMVYCFAIVTAFVYALPEKGKDYPATTRLVDAKKN